MRWYFKWQKELKSGIYWKLLQDGFIKPEDTEPDITGFQFYFDAFEELSTARISGFAVGPIPFTAIVEYFRIFELEDFEEFAYIIRRMDNLFLELNVAATAKTNSPAKAKDGSPSASADTNKKNNNQSGRVRQQGAKRNRR